MSEWHLTDRIEHTIRRHEMLFATLFHLFGYRITFALFLGYERFAPLLVLCFLSFFSFDPVFVSLLNIPVNESVFSCIYRHSMQVRVLVSFKWYDYFTSFSPLLAFFLFVDTLSLSLSAFVLSFSLSLSLSLSEFCAQLAIGPLDCHWYE